MLSQQSQLCRNMVLYGIIVLGLILPVYSIYAYSPFAVASEVDMPNKPKIGTIVSRENSLFRLSNQRYDVAIAGVIVDNADIIVQEAGTNEDSTLMIDRGEALLLVNGEKGPISIGDFITSSSTAGQGMKAENDGIVVAVALEDFTPKDAEDSGLINAMVDVHYTNVSTSSSLREALASASPMFRYTLTIVIIIVALISGFLLFGRIAKHGIKALGRNPLARKTIIGGIVINSFFTILLVSLAIVFAYFIITV